MPGLWEYNPPPNWPKDQVPDLDWRPDPSWGPLPVGWPLWKRRRVPLSDRPVIRALISLVTVAASVLLGGMLGLLRSPQTSQH